MSTVYDPQNVFGKILRGEIPCYKVFEDDVAFGFMDVMPRGEGHTLVIPKAPARGLLDIPPEVLAGLITRVQKIGAAVVKAFSADGLTLQQFNETAGGQQVFHLHFHLLPRFEGVALRPHTGEMAPADVLSEHASRIRAAL